jgi:hypothetical protein
VAQATFCAHFQKWKKVALGSGLRTYHINEFKVNVMI